MLFRGSHTVKVDDKGRLKLPALVKDRLAEQYGKDTPYFVTKLSGDAVLIYPLPEWQRIEEALAQAPQFDPVKNRFLFHAHRNGGEATVDEQGRLLIPSKLRDTLEIKGEVALYWQSNRIEVYNLARYEAEAEQHPLTPEDLREMAKYGV